ncbi:glycosyltransferase [Microbacterium aerolatum]|uniref:glycosyltransferase n=1 Tax=Microbacterium aerolatum TaxID=153731 RepID=UPI0020016CF1|nr:glycosyltransferase [Microbacterium aerolatum]MCK3769974.1 glycosyltransferase [Microbacterium aerolatum]
MAHAAVTASVIIPAHNEEAVIARTLEPLADAAARGALEVIVVCNACADRTAEIAGAFPGVSVLESGIPSKTHALNLGDETATSWPRIYLDADIVVSEQSITATAIALSTRRWLAARPRSDFVMTGTGPMVRAYYRARSRMPSLGRAMWGAGVYGLSEEGHRRLGRFPDVTGDDLWVDRLFAPDEKTVIAAEPVAVRVPRTISALVAISRRNVSGAREAGPVVGPDATSASGQEAVDQHDPAGVLRELLGTIRSPLTAFDAMVYIAIALSSRLGRHSARWERDDTSRA